MEDPEPLGPMMAAVESYFLLPCLQGKVALRQAPPVHHWQNSKVEVGSFADHCSYYHSPWIAEIRNIILGFLSAILKSVLPLHRKPPSMVAS